MQEAAAIKDPETEKLLVNRDEIKKSTVRYCVNNLRNNIPDNDVKELVNKRKYEQVKKMRMKRGDTFETSLDEYEQVLEKFKMKTTKTYDFILKSGDRYKRAIFKICKRIIDKEDIPDSFRTTTLHMIWKRKGPIDILKNNRFLHMKDVYARIVDSLIVQQMKQPLI